MTASTTNGGEAMAERRFVGVFACVLLLFLLSGSCGLIYQVLWTRKLALLFGATAYAVSAVLTVFFLGLGVGSLVGGRLADRTRFPLRFYGIFEVIISLWAGMFILALPILEPVIPVLLRTFDFSHATGIVLRALLTLLLLCVPVTLMGATLPLLSRFAAGSDKHFGRRLGALYAVNTLGAVLGCVLAGFVLIATLGYTRATLVGFALNLCAGFGAILLSCFQEPTNSDCGAGEAKRNPPSDYAPDVAAGFASLHPPHSYSNMNLLLWTTGICGFCGLALEVVWTRLLAIVFLGTTYAYTTMLTAFLCGIATGSACASLVSDRLRGRTFAIGVALMLLALCIVLQLGWTAALPARFIEMSRAVHADWSGVIEGTFLLSFATLFPMTFLFGFLFPLILRAYSVADAFAGRHVGRVYAANTLGGVLGSAAGGFLLLPILGAHWSIIVLALALLAPGIALTWTCRRTGLWVKASTTLLFLIVSVFVFSGIPKDVSQALNVGYVPPDHRALFFKEGIEGTVVVTEPETAVAGEDRVLWINRVQATTSIERGVKMNRLQGVLPLLFEPDYHDILFMCFGSGITCGTLALYDFHTIDAVEICPEVLEAAPLFDRDNLGVLENPKVHFHIDDGRNYLLRTGKTYDVITFEPMPLALAGVSTFYTHEYYTLCLNHLKPGGIVSQWIPLHSNSPEVVRDLAQTFISVFPEYCAFFVNADLFLIGSDAPPLMHYEKAKSRLNTPALRQALADAGLGDAIEVLSCYLLDKAGLDAFTEGASVMSDDRPWAEFIAPRLVYARLVPEALRLLLPNMANPVDAVIPESMDEETRKALERRYRSRQQDMQALQEYYGGSMFDDSAANGFIASLEIDPHNLNAQYYLREIALAQGNLLLRWEDYERAAAFLGGALQFLPEDETLQAMLNQAKREISAITEN